jgi:hypothetical protein
MVVVGLLESRLILVLLFWSCYAWWICCLGVGVLRVGLALASVCWMLWWLYCCWLGRRGAAWFWWGLFEGVLTVVVVVVDWGGVWLGFFLGLGSCPGAPERVGYVDTPCWRTLSFYRTSGTFWWWRGGGWLIPSVCGFSLI